MLFYRVLHAVRQRFPFVVLGVYICAFAIALGFMFIFPPMTLLLLGMGLASLALVVCGAKLLDVCDRSVARSILRSGACPSCGRRIDVHRDETTRWRCPHCETIFRPDGGEQDPAAPWSEEQEAAEGAPAVAGGAVER